MEFNPWPMGAAVLKARVRAAPNEDEANAALVGMIATSLGVPVRSVCVVAGATARVKRVAIAGDTAALIARLQK